mmetsp:Transcript_859/g.1958  ORF Transcript_859/g.1958 Transcript_859/m.1958 type:complete len:223 (+) Transcript_859:369-1037(+)
MRLAAAVESLCVLGLLDEHLVAFLLRDCRVSDAEAAGRYIQAARNAKLPALLKELGPAQEAVLHLILVQVVEELGDAPVALSGKMKALHVPSPLRHHLPSQSKGEAVLFVKVPDVRALVIVQERDLESGAASQAGSNYGRLAAHAESRVAASHERGLVLPHFEHGALEGIADLPISGRDEDLDWTIARRGEEPRAVGRTHLLDPEQCRAFVGGVVAPSAYAL